MEGASDTGHRRFKDEPPPATYRRGTNDTKRGNPSSLGLFSCLQRTGDGVPIAFPLYSLRTDFGQGTFFQARKG